MNTPNEEEILKKFKSRDRKKSIKMKIDGANVKKLAILKIAKKNKK